MTRMQTNRYRQANASFGDYNVVVTHNLIRTDAPDDLLSTLELQWGCEGIRHELETPSNLLTLSICDGRAFHEGRWICIPTKSLRTYIITHLGQGLESGLYVYRNDFLPVGREYNYDMIVLDERDVRASALSADSTLRSLAHPYYTIWDGLLKLVQYRLLTPEQHEIYLELRRITHLWELLLKLRFNQGAASTESPYVGGTGSRGRGEIEQVPRQHGFPGESTFAMMGSKRKREDEEESLDQVERLLPAKKHVKIEELDSHVPLPIPKVPGPRASIPHGPKIEELVLDALLYVRRLPGPGEDPLQVLKIEKLEDEGLFSIKRLRGPREDPLQVPKIEKLEDEGLFAIKRLPGPWADLQQVPKIEELDPHVPVPQALMNVEEFNPDDLLRYSDEEPTGGLHRPWADLSHGSDALGTNGDGAQLDDHVSSSTSEQMKVDQHSTLPVTKPLAKHTWVSSDGWLQPSSETMLTGSDSEQRTILSGTQPLAERIWTPNDRWHRSSSEATVPGTDSGGRRGDHSDEHANLTSHPTKWLRTSAYDPPSTLGLMLKHPDGKYRFARQLLSGSITIGSYDDVSEIDPALPASRQAEVEQHSSASSLSRSECSRERIWTPSEWWVRSTLAKLVQTHAMPRTDGEFI